jgi:hypothetical protein
MENFNGDKSAVVLTADTMASIRQRGLCIHSHHRKEFVDG